MSSDKERAEIVPPTTAVDGGYDATGKSPQEIENDISETRAALGSILHEIEREIAPRHLLERAIGSLKDGKDGGVGGRIGETLRASPMALILMGVGIGWFALSTSRSSGRLDEYRGALGERVSGELEGASDRAAPLVGSDQAFPPSEEPIANPIDYAFAGEKSADDAGEKEHIAAGMSEVGKNEPLSEMRSGQPHANSSEG